MSAVVILDSIGVPSGSNSARYSGLTFSPSSALTAISGIMDTSLGHYRLLYGNGANEGFPNVALTSYSTTFTPSSTTTEIRGFVGNGYPPASTSGMLVFCSM